MSSSHSNYAKMTARDALQLASPPTWGASFMPVLVAGALALGPLGGAALHAQPAWRLALLFVLMLVTAVLLQSAVNTLNDYADFTKGTDTAENSVDLVDVPLVSRNLNPRDALKVVIGYLVAAAVTGFIVVGFTGWITLVIGLVAAVIVVLYSAGPKPISYLPIGELVSGLVMGELIAFATFYVLTGALVWSVLFWALPLLMTIGSIMQVNNTSDIERDREAGRRTFPTLVGAKTSGWLLLVWGCIALAVIATYAFIYASPWGWIGLLGAVVMCLPTLARWPIFPFGFKNRPRAMMTIARQNIVLNAWYVITILIGVIAS